MNRIFFALALLLPFSAEHQMSTPLPPDGLQVVGPSVLMNQARQGPVAIVDLRAHGRNVPGATRNWIAPIAPGQVVFALGSIETAQQWATKRGLTTLQVVPPVMIEFENMKGVPQIEPVEARSKSQKGWPLFDISEGFEFEAERLPGSRRLDYGEFQRGKWDALPKQGPFIVACRVGHRSQLVVQKLRAAGFDARNLRGGLWEWQCQNLPLDVNPRLAASPLISDLCWHWCR
jgi:rhodanese-related sulfurtransferase